MRETFQSIDANIFQTVYWLIYHFILQVAELHFKTAQSILVSVKRLCACLWQRAAALATAAPLMLPSESTRRKVIAANKHWDPESHEGSCSPAAICVCREQEWGQAPPSASELPRSVAQRRLVLEAHSPSFPENIDNAVSNLWSAALCMWWTPALQRNVINWDEDSWPELTFRLTKDKVT